MKYLIILLCLLTTVNIRAQVLTEQQTVEILKKSKFSPTLIPLALCVIKYESRFNTKAKNLNKNKTIDTGLFQVNSANLNSCNVTMEELQDPYVNARCALKIVNKQGLSAWMAYNEHRSECHEYADDYLNGSNILLRNKTPM